ncbi:MAG: hypothetical protein Q8L95_12920 [Burkholderiales bacterium]|nr:hypothetical protein [Burkholderiales bacterium]
MRHDTGARELPGVQAGFGGFYNANSAKLILSEVMREHGQLAVNQLITELDLQRIFGFKQGTGSRDKGTLEAKQVLRSTQNKGTLARPRPRADKVYSIKTIG